MNKITLNKSPQPALQVTHTVVILLKGNQILLGMKKTGFGKGNYIGPGGKIEQNESSVEGLIREVNEEVGLKIKNPMQIGTLDFHFSHKPDWGQVVDAYYCDFWQGNPIETDELRPELFDIDKIPYAQMWDDNKYWIPLVLEKKPFSAKFSFNESLGVTKYEVRF